MDMINRHQTSDFKGSKRKSSDNGEDIHVRETQKKSLETIESKEFSATKCKVMESASAGSKVPEFVKNEWLATASDSEGLDDEDGTLIVHMRVW